MENIIGIDIGGTTIKASLVFDKKPVSKIEVETNANGSADSILDPLFDQINSTWKGSFEAAGVGVPGYIDTEAGIIKVINNIPAFSGLNLKEKIEQKLGVPVKIENDANCFILGEYFFGEACMLNNVIGITLGTGVGGGVIINRKVYSGMNGGAGEFGMIPFLDSNFEWYLGSNFFQHNYGKTGKEICNDADNGDKNALEAFHLYGTYLGDLLNILMCAYSPEAFILGGSITNAYKYFYPGMIEGLKKYPFDLNRNALRIFPASVQYAGMLGAAALWL